MTILILLIALGVLGWGFYRAKPFGKVGMLAWSQSAVLMVPWLGFFGLFAAGIYLNLAQLLLMFVASTGLYIFLGRQLRTASQDPAFIQPTSTAAHSPDPVESQAEKPIAQPVELPKPDTLAIPEPDLKLIQSIFGVDTFFATETIPYQEGAIFKGNLRGGVEPVFSRLSSNLQERLEGRYRLFLVENPDGKPVVIVLPSSSDPRPTTVPQLLVAIGLFVATIAASLETAGLLMGFDFFNTPTRWREVMPIALGILAILGTHEMGHRWLAQRHNVRLSPPFFIPTWQIGSFGALTRFESLVPSRKVLFDVAFAGPAAGGALSLVMLLVGLLLSHPGSVFQIPSQFFQGSVLVGSLARIVLGDALQSPLVDVHPLTIVGWLGLVITALNLMPAGQLDGGRIVQAIYGRKTAQRSTLATFVVLAIASLVNPLALYWAVIILVLQRDLERPSLNDISEPDDTRAALGLLVLFLMIAILLPLTPSLAGRLGIGS